MLRYVSIRFVAALLLAWAVATIVFLFIRLIPGDPAALIAGDRATPQQVHAVRQSMGLSDPLSVQYVRWFGRLFCGDLGVSLVSDRPVSQDLVAQLPRTLELILAALVLSVLAGVPLGVLAAIRRDRPADLVSGILALLGLSLPNFVVATLLVLIVSVRLRLLPSSGYVPFLQHPIQHLRLLLLPTISLAVALTGVVMRMTRSSLLEVLSQDYVRTARAKGLREITVLFSHVLRTSLIPVITILGVELGSLLGGTVVIEYIFSWPGLSSLLFRGISQRDYPLVQGVVLLIAAVFILTNLLVDTLNALLDPRIRYA